MKPGVSAPSKQLSLDWSALGGAHLLSMLLYICYYIYVAAPAHGEVHALDLVGPVSSFPRQSTYTLTLNLSGGSGITDMSAFKLRRASRRAVIVYATNSKLA